MNIFGKTLSILLFLATVMLASCNSSQSTPTTSQADRMETAISTVSTAFAALTEAPRAIPTVSFSATTPIAPPTMPVPSPQPGVILVEVHADQDWQDTGVTVQVNDKVKVRYISGTWSICPCWGYVDSQGHSYSPHAANPIPDAQPGELIGKIGQSLFRIGRQVEFASQSEGHLYLRMNDDIFADNDGVLLVQISVRKP